MENSELLLYRELVGEARCESLYMLWEDLGKFRVLPLYIGLKTQKNSEALLHKELVGEASCEWSCMLRDLEKLRTPP